jgi:GNAT superfamily N-acetyltransferase
VRVDPLPAGIYHLLDACRMFGVPHAMQVATRWVIRREFFVFSRDVSISPGTEPSDSGRWTCLTETDISRLRDVNPALRVAEIRRRIREGQKCLLYWHGEVVVHYTWRASTRTYLPYLGKSICPQEGDVFVVESFTHPAFRRRGIHAQSIRHTIREAQKSGMRRRLSMVPWWNVPSSRALHHNGCEVVGMVGRWSIGVWHQFFATGDVWLDGPCVSVLRADRA